MRQYGREGRSSIHTCESRFVISFNYCCLGFLLYLSLSALILSTYQDFLLRVGPFSSVNEIMKLWKNGVDAEVYDWLHLFKNVTVFYVLEFKWCGSEDIFWKRFQKRLTALSEALDSASGSVWQRFRKRVLRKTLFKRFQKFFYLSGPIIPSRPCTRPARADR